MENAERCVCCGEIIPEGRMVCPNCEVASKEKRLIDANAIVEKFSNHKALFLNKMGGFQALLQREKGRVDELDNCIADVINAPTVDAVEVVHGRWKEVYTCSGEWLWGYSCDQCGEGHSKKSNYCPNCGADMRERKDNGEV